MKRSACVLMMIAAGLVPAACGGEDEAEPEAAATVEAVESVEPTAEATEEATAEATPTAEAVEAGSLERPDADNDGIPDVQTFRGSLGDSFTLVGQPGYKKQSKDAVQVTVKEIIGPFDGFDLDPGRELIGVTLTFEGLGEKPYSDPQPSGDLTLSNGETGDATSLIVTGGESPCDDPSIKLDKGETADACIAFEVASNSKPRVFEYAADSGYGDVGIWQLK